MQEERNTSMGSAIVDVFDAAVALVKAEINSLTRKVTDLVKAKGLGVVLLLASVVPLSMALIFLILAVYFGLVALGLPWWGASLLMFVLGLLVAGALVAMGLGKLNSDIDPGHSALTEDQRLEAEYLAEQRRRREEGEAPVSGAVVATAVPATVGRHPAEDRPDYKYFNQARGETRHAVQGSETYGRAEAAPGAEGYVNPGTEGSHAVPVYEASADGSPQYYGQNLNEKLDEHGADHRADHRTGGHGHHEEHDPNIVHPEPLAGVPEVHVSTQPTYAEDMRRANEGGHK